jgi:glycosyltransferase involved in cell wall biosynthesis
MRRPVIVFGEDWGRHPTSTQHLFRHIAKDRQVLWVNSVGMRRPRLTDMSRLVKKGMAIAKPKKRENTDTAKTPFPVLAPAALPLPGSLVARSFNRKVLAGQVRKAANDLGFVDPLLWISVPTAVDIVGCLDEGAVAYYCGDDFSSLAGVDHKPVARLEQELAEKSDVIFAASRMLASRFDDGRTVYLPHGVDIDLFSQPCPRATDLPEGKVAGFYGSIAPWLDQGLIVRTARHLPDWTFLFIGNECCDVSALRAEPNISLIGPRPHHELPRYSRHWNASILPFKLNGQIKACNPLKLREYLAAGTPICSTNFPALDGYRDHVRVARSAEALAVMLMASLSETEAARKSRQAVVCGESWKDRAQQAADCLDGL